MSNKILHLVQDWLDIDFAIKQGVDFIAVSFVKSAEVINNLKSYLSSRADKVIEIIAKVESHDSVPNLEEIVAASDAVMVARGDLGAQLPRLCLHPVHQFLLHHAQPLLFHVLHTGASASALSQTLALLLYMAASV